MNLKRKIQIFALIVFFLGTFIGVGCFFFEIKQDASGSALDATPPRNFFPIDIKKGAEKSIEKKDKESIVPTGKSIATEFSTSKNFRAFIESSRQRSKEGAYPYIFDSIKQCEYLSKNQVKYDPLEDAKTYTKRT